MGRLFYHPIFLRWEVGKSLSEKIVAQKCKVNEPKWTCYQGTNTYPTRGKGTTSSKVPVGEESSQHWFLSFFLIFNSSQDFKVSSRITAQLLEKPCRWRGMWALHRPQTLPGSHQWSGEQLNPHESRRWGRIRFNKIDPLWKWWYFFHSSLWPNFSELNVSGFAFKKPHRDRYMNIQPKRKLQ